MKSMRSGFLFDLHSLVLVKLTQYCSFSQLCYGQPMRPTSNELPKILQAEII